MNDGAQLGINVEPREPETVNCEWCDKPSVEAFELKAKGRFVYACAGHRHLARLAQENPKRTRGA